MEITHIKGLATRQGAAGFVENYSKSGLISQPKNINSRGEMKPSILRLFLALGFCVFSICSSVCFGQIDPKNVPQPPTAELKKFDPFLGKYQVSGDYANLPWTGTLEFKKAIKGWYIEKIILVKTEGIDRELRTFATWDKNVQKYRTWGFQTTPTMPDNGGEIRFEGDQMIVELVSSRPDGTKVMFSDRIRVVSKDELELVSLMRVGNGATEKIGSLKCKRISSANVEAGGAAFDVSGSHN